MTRHLAATLLAFSLVACGGADDAVEAEPAAEATAAIGDQQARAVLLNAAGEEIGTATARQAEGGIALSIAVEGLSPGEHGAHIHDTAACEPDFMAAGPHWAPFDAALGLGDDDPANDSDNATVTVGEDGAGMLEYTLATQESFETMMSGDGASFMIHQREADPAMETAPGNDDRIACGVFEVAEG
ncbi:superoxide dismutase family protein [Erythrobacter sp.]|jgi:Cu-Zn family superoxide dismutase|uniref:superoxide dismutase family protein n=1 Tax=Erythrobacter sp. TaxID=1042 RepID=UPI002EA41922|nr:superoxide dismutase family protein [Erythrobacter sp.]